MSRLIASALPMLLLLSGCAANAPIAADRPLGDAPAYDAAVDRKVAEIHDDLIRIRRRIHENPELGNREFETAKLAAEHLRKLGFEVKIGVGKTGVVALLKGGLPGPVIAARADMDALPVIEATGLPFASKVTTIKPGTEQRVGVMHACGHDVHTTCLLGTATVLASMRDKLPGTIKFIFQPAEEGAPDGEEGGAALMIKEGVMTDPAPVAVFGLHCDPEVEAGMIGYTPGPMMAAVDHIKIRIIGKGGHAAWPARTIDPVVVAAQAILAIQTIHSRQIDTTYPSVISLGSINGGTRWNILPDEVRLEGTVRTFQQHVRRDILARLQRTLDGVAASAGATAKLEVSDYGPSLVNDEALTAQVVPALQRAVGSAKVRKMPLIMGGEDFSLFMEKIPGHYYRLGTRSPSEAADAVAPLHSNKYSPDEACIDVGVKSMCRVLLDALHRGK